VVKEREIMRQLCGYVQRQKYLENHDAAGPTGMAHSGILGHDGADVEWHPLGAGRGAVRGPIELILVAVLLRDGAGPDLDACGV